MLIELKSIFNCQSSGLPRKYSQLIIKKSAFLFCIVLVYLYLCTLKSNKKTNAKNII